MTEVAAIVDQMRRAFDGDAWHGPSVHEVLTRVTAVQAAARPLPAAHSIWEIVLHMAAWKGEVRRRLAGGTPGLPEEGDWPAVPEQPTEEAWAAAQQALAHAHDALLRAAQTLPESRLPEPVGGERDRSAGTGVSHYVTLHGIVQHDLYHAGQIALLKKAGA